MFIHFVHFLHNLPPLSHFSNVRQPHPLCVSSLIVQFPSCAILRPFNFFFLVLRNEEFWVGKKNGREKREKEGEETWRRSVESGRVCCLTVCV